MLSPYSAKAIALQILFRRIRRVDRVLATSRLRRRYFFNDPPLIPRGPSNSVAPPSSSCFCLFLLRLANFSSSSGPLSLSLFLSSLFRAFVRSEEEEACPSRVLPGKDFVRSLKRLIDENEPRTGSYEDFITGLLLHEASSVQENYVCCADSKWVEFGEVWDTWDYLSLFEIFNWLTFSMG